VPSEPGEPLVGVSETALGAAEMRSEESLRPERLFDDPYAAAFVAAAPPLFPDLPSIDDDPTMAALKEEFVTGIAIRTRFYDEYLLAACAVGCRQVVLLAAGLDTRAFRLNWPADLRLFEVDLPELFVFKERVLAQQGAAPRCSRTVVGIDLREDWPARLTDAGFDPNVPSVWTAEGLLPFCRMTMPRVCSRTSANCARVAVACRSITTSSPTIRSSANSARRRGCGRLHRCGKGV
jgi:methyltransferase (TIGR00027 family)